MLVRANDRPDVVIAGAGVAGLALGILLAKDGLRPVCIDPDLPPRTRVGESLDWSAPALLAELGGMPQEEIGRRMGSNRNAVYKLTYDARRRLKRGLEAKGYTDSDVRGVFGW